MDETQRYDVIGDLHGCTPALRALADELGYDGRYRHPDGRRLVFVGDIADRGPDNTGAFRLVMELVETGLALNVLGNHDYGMLRHLMGLWDDLEGSIAATVLEIDAQPDVHELKARIVRFLSNTPLILHLDCGRLVVAHAGIEPDMLGRPLDERARQFILNGDAIGKSPEGKTLRRDWAADYRGAAFIVYGHTPQEQPLLRENSVNIDTGAYRKRALTALRWPEKETASVQSSW